MMKKRYIFGIIILALIIIGGLYFSPKDQPQSATTLSASSQQEVKPPDFTLPTFDDTKQINLTSSYSDRPTVVQFWATWCEFCRKEFPVTNAIVATYEGKINFIAVNFSQESRSQVRNYIKELELNPGVLTFVMDESGAVGRAYGVTGTPVHLFLKKGGDVSLFQIGYMSPQKMKEEIEKIL